MHHIDRIFDTWKEGLLELVVNIMIPIIPLCVYLGEKQKSTGYFSTLLITLILCLAYYFFKQCNNISCSTIIKIENIINCVTLVIMFGITMFNLTYSYSSENIAGLNALDYITFSLFIIPIITYIFEIIRAIIKDIKVSKCNSQQNNKNISKGAANV